MALLAEFGAETQNVTTGVEATTNGITLETTIKRSGNASFKVSGTIAAQTASSVSANRNFATHIYVQAAFYISSLDDTDGTAYVKVTNTASTNTYIDLQINNYGGSIVPVVYYNNYALTLTNTATISYNTWHVAEFHIDNSLSNGSKVLEVKIDGTSVASSSTITNPTGTPGNLECGIYNANASASITGSTVYFDDCIVCDTTGSYMNSWINKARLVMARPTGAGDNAATAGLYSSVNEVPVSDTATSSANRIELDTLSTIADYNMTDSSTLGINSYDNIKAISILDRVKEEAAATTSYQLRIKSASGGTTSTSTATDAGNTTLRTNPSGTTAFGHRLVSYIDPTTGVAWTPTGTNSIDNMQVGVASLTDNDIWFAWLGAYIVYTDGTAPGGTAIKDLIGGFGIIPFPR